MVLFSCWQDNQEKGYAINSNNDQADNRFLKVRDRKVVQAKGV